MTKKKLRTKAKVVMVCLGNICRSPLAEGVLQKLVRDEGLAESFIIDSAGTADYHVGDLPDHRSIRVAEKNGIKLKHRGRQFSRNDFKEFNYILVMDQSNYQNVIQLAPGETDKSKVILLASYDKTQKHGAFVADPYYEEIEAFDLMYDHILRCCQSFLEHILAQELKHQ